MTDTTDKYRTNTFQYIPVVQEDNIASKRRVMEVMQAMTTAPIAELADAAAAGYAAAAEVHVTHPINDLRGHDALLAAYWLPLRQAFPDLERREYIVVGGLYRDSSWVACLGHYVGTFAQEWLGIPATRGVVTVRFAEGHQVVNGRIAASYVFIDFLDLMRQAGYWPIAPDLGSTMPWLPPKPLDGVVLTPQEDARSQRTIESILRMHRALGYYNGQPPTRAVLDEMEMVRHWDPRFMWFGPAGIGTTRGLAGFEDYHQIPFLVAFPDRGGSDVGHFIRVGDGYYAATGGWGYLQATHTGGDFLGMPPTGRRIAMRVMDFYRCDDSTICENWIPMDVPHILLQMGVDVFGRMRHQARAARPTRTTDWLVPGG